MIINKEVGVDAFEFPKNPKFTLVSLKDFKTRQKNIESASFPNREENYLG